MSSTARIRVVDSHTGGEPTRVVFGGAPDLGPGTVAERATRFAREHSAFRRAVVCEPRGFDAMVGALLVEPDDPTSDAAVIFFNDVGPLGMCGHGTIGLVRTLEHLGRATTERLTIETPAGKVTTERTGAHSVRVANVPSRRHAVDVSVEVPGYGTFVGDVAWGGNWFFLARTPAGVDLRGENVLELTVRARAVRAALAAAGITGACGAEIDHVEFFARPEDPANDSRNFVLCPGGAFDRSPCGTGTSAKLACLAADGKLAPGALWRQESVIGSVFQASYDAGEDGSILPHIEGSAHVTAEGELLLDLDDPYHAGIPGLSGALPPRADER